MRPMLILNLAALSPREIDGNTPVLQALARSGCASPMRAAFPMLTCSSHATMLTGEPPAEHGVVANGWHERAYAKTFMWNRSDHLVTGDKLWEAARARKPGLRCANLFWRFCADSSCDIAVTERPTYWSSGRKSFDFFTKPSGLHDRLQGKLGKFPFPQFWGPMAGLKSTRWILDATIDIMQRDNPELVLSYAPYLDYEAQRHGPASPEARSALANLDRALTPVLEAAKAQDRDVAIVSDYGFTTVDTPVYLNKVLRQAGYLNVEEAANGDQIDAGTSRAFAVCDNQVAHVYVSDSADLEPVRALLKHQPGVADVLDGDGKAAAGIDHPRSGELVAVAGPHHWFAYRYWLEDNREPDFARCIAIFDKAGFDPCELFPKAGPLGKPHMALRLAQKVAGLAVPFDVIDPDESRPRGARNISPASDQEQATLLTSWPRDGAAPPRMQDLKSLVLARMFPET